MLTGENKKQLFYYFCMYVVFLVFKFTKHDCKISMQGSQTLSLSAIALTFIHFEDTFIQSDFKLGNT